MKRDTRQFFKKLALLVAGVVVLQILLTNVFRIYDKTVIKPDWANAFSDSYDFMIFGDSTLNYTCTGEKPESSIIGQLQRKMPGVRIMNQGHAGHHLEIWNDALHYVARRGLPWPKVVIIPINLGSFDVEWTMKPGFQRDLERIYLREHGKPWFKYLYKFLFTFGVFKAQSISDEEYDLAYKNSAYSKYPGTKGQLMERYMTRLALDPSDQTGARVAARVRALSEISTLLRSRGQRAVFYVNPIEQELGARFIGPDFRQNLSANIGLLSQILERDGYHLENYAFTLPKSVFDSPADRSSEHLCLAGRRYVADRLGAAIQESLQGRRVPDSTRRQH